MKEKWIYSAQLLITSIALQKCHACSEESRDEARCWYTLWYIWFVLGLFVIVIAVLIVLYIKHRTKERSRARRRRRSTRTHPIHIVPMGPPGYAEPSHKPPSYEEACRRHTITSQSAVVPGIIESNTEEYGYQPPPTSMRIATPISGTYQPQPPPYSSVIQGQGHPT